MEGIFSSESSESTEPGGLESEFGLELRLSLPEGWTLFWKRREEGSLALMAHPEANEWVGTLALDLDFGIQMLRFLRELKEKGQSFSLDQCGTLRPVSNLEARFSIQMK